MAQEPILRIQGVSKRFRKKKILKGVNLDVQEGEILGLIGSSGSGKTTLLKTIIGFYTPEEGDVRFKADDFLKRKNVSRKLGFVSVFKEQKLAKNIFGFASQDPSFYEMLTVRENLMHFGSLYNLPSKALKSNVEILLSLMDLKQAQNTLGGKLSGGMERRLDIACALIHDPEILILDEPTSDLDPILRDHIWSLVRKINRKGTTIILASHHLSEVETFCSRIAIIKDGSIIEVDTPAKLKARHADSEEIVIQTYPGNYSNIAKAMKRPGGKVFEVKLMGSEMVIYCNQPKTVLHELLHTLESLDEELIDIRVSRPGLDELFLKLTKNDEESRGGA
jgi:ABC-2 type transport system ATP-binding protein